MSKHHHQHTFNDRSSTAALLATRRSGKPRNMTEPGPDDAQLQRILGAAVRVPDHGKLHPWRFVVIGPEKRGAFAELLKQALRDGEKAGGDKPRDKHFEAAEDFANQAPCLVVAISEPVQPSKIPLWEQELSCGAACQNLLLAAHAEGFIGGWLTEWPAYSNTVTAAFTQHGRIAGFIFLGTPGHELEERPRPVFEEVVTHWQG